MLLLPLLLYLCFLFYFFCCLYVLIRIWFIFVCNFNVFVFLPIRIQIDTIFGVLHELHLSINSISELPCNHFFSAEYRLNECMKHWTLNLKCDKKYDWNRNRFAHSDSTIYKLYCVDIDTVSLVKSYGRQIEKLKVINMTW